MERNLNGSLPGGLSAEFDLKYGLKLLWSSKATIVAVAVLGLGLGFLLTYLETPIYRSQTLIQIDPPGQNLAALTNPYPATAFNWFDHQSYYNTQYRIMKSKAMAERVVQKLKLAETPSTAALNSAAGLLLSRVEVIPVPDTRLAQIAVTHEDPQKAALWANTLAEAYVEQNLEAKVEATRNVYTWLQERLSAAQDSVRRSEEKLYQYTEGEDLFVPQDRETLVGGTLEKLNEAYTEAKTRRIGLETTLAQIRSLKQSGKSVETAPQIAVDPLVQSQNLKRAALEGELVQLQGKYKKEHPEIKNRLSQLDQIKGTIAAQAEKIIAGLEAEYNQLRRREGELLATVNQQKKQSVEQGRKAVQLEMLQREALSNKNLYEVILQKIKETDIAGSLRNNNVSIVETAAVPSAPIRPQPVKNLLVALAVGLLAGCGLVLLRDYLSHTLKEEEEIETHLGAACLAVVPQHSDSNGSVVTETYRTLCTNLLFNRDRERGNVVLITSSIPQEGKSTTALNAARALAEAGEPTLLIDFDLRRSCQHARLRLYREPGLTDYCARDLQVDAVIQQTRHKNLSAITSGRQPHNPPALIGSRAVERLLGECRERFTWIVLDAPPVASVTDSLLLAKLADMVLVVVRYNKVDRKLARRSMAALGRTNARVVGIVLNGLDPKQDSYHYYYSYYSSKEAPEPVAKVATAGSRR
jgi:capsular exopolysaccharide synthesis family protein